MNVRKKLLKNETPSTCDNPYIIWIVELLLLTDSFGKVFE